MSLLSAAVKKNLFFRILRTLYSPAGAVSDNGKAADRKSFQFRLQAGGLIRITV
jgi:hypothetical protein